MSELHGLSVRWSLRDATAGVEQRLRDYVVGTSLARFTGMPGLAFKTWRMVPGEWFEGTYVFAGAAPRDEFLSGFRQDAPTSPVSTLVGCPPELMEPFEVVAVAAGGAGFSATGSS